MKYLKTQKTKFAKIALVFSAIFAFTFSIFATENNTEEDFVFTVAEVMPEFPGGNLAMLKFIAENLYYPFEAFQNREEGRVIVQFVVERTGELTDIQVVRGASPLFDEEAILLVKSMPNFIPGKQAGEKVRVRFTLPVMFTLPEIEENNEIPPQFPGGTQAMMRFLNENIRYPAIAMGNNQQGRVILQYVVDVTGEIVDITIVRSSGFPLLDKEAIRVVQLMPNWIPGEQDGRKVRTRFTLPVVFRLDDTPTLIPSSTQSLQPRYVQTRRNRQR